MPLERQTKWSTSGADTLVPSSAGILKLQGNSGGLEIYGGTATDEDLTLYPHNQAYDSLDNDGRIVLGERVAINQDRTLTNGATIPFLGEPASHVQFRHDGTYTTSGAELPSVTGFTSATKLIYDVGASIAAAPTFYANSVVQPTAAVTDNSGAYWTGFQYRS